MFSFLITNVLNLFFLGTGLIYNQSSPIKIESIESKNFDLKPVYNKISLTSNYQQDIWRMDQSHFGENPSQHQWERLYIYVDKRKIPYEATFYQLKPGKTDIKEQVEYRASCYSCHVNGPRLIRPNVDKISMKDKLIISLWNFKIKSYGKIVPSQKNLAQTFEKVPFWYSSNHENKTLEVKTCLRCHNDGAWPNRSKIKRQQVGTVQFLISNHYMPPMGFKLSKKEIEELNAFINGF